MKRVLFPGSVRWMLVLAVLVLIVPKAVQATTWNLTVGAESKDEAKQAMAFLPNEIWISVNDSITWTTGSHEGHTVTLLKPGQIRPKNGAVNMAGMGCFDIDGSAVQPSGSEYIGAGTDAAGDPLAPAADAAGAGDTDDFACVNSGRLSLPTATLPVDPTMYTITFPVAGNFKFVCLVHKDMTGVVHVVTGPLPHNNPDFYEDEAADQARQILSDTDKHEADHDRGDNDRGNWYAHGDRNKVITFGELIATGGGRQYLTIMRFLPSTIYVDVGDTVEWTNVDPTEPHTVTFDDLARFPMGGMDPKAVVPAPDPDNDLDVDGTLPLADPGVICGAGDLIKLTNCFTSGNIGAANQDQTGSPQPDPTPTRVFVTFTSSGIYNYYCALHDELGMEGKVIVGNGEDEHDPQ